MKFRPMAVAAVASKISNAETASPRLSFLARNNMSGPSLGSLDSLGLPSTVGYQGTFSLAGLPQGLRLLILRSLRSDLPLLGELPGRDHLCLAKAWRLLGSPHPTNYNPGDSLAPAAEVFCPAGPLINRMATISLGIDARSGGTGAARRQILASPSARSRWYRTPGHRLRGGARGRATSSQPGRQPGGGRP